jgi:hypothetical protein
MCPVDHPYLHRMAVEAEAADLLGPLLSLLERDQVHPSLMVSIMSSLLLLLVTRLVIRRLPHCRTSLEGLAHLPFLE